MNRAAPRDGIRHTRAPWGYARRVRHIEAGQNIQLDTLERVAAALAVHARVLLDPPSPRQEPRRPGRPRKARAYDVTIGEVDAAVADVWPKRSRRPRKPSR